MLIEVSYDVIKLLHRQQKKVQLAFNKVYEKSHAGRVGSSTFDPKVIGSNAGLVPMDFSIQNNYVCITRA